MPIIKLFNFNLNENSTLTMLLHSSVYQLETFYKPNRETKSNRVKDRESERGVRRRDANVVWSSSCRLTLQHPSN